MYNTFFGALPIGAACVIKNRSLKGSIAGLITLTLTILQKENLPGILLLYHKPA